MSNLDLVRSCHFLNLHRLLLQLSSIIYVELLQNSEFIEYCEISWNVWFELPDIPVSIFCATLLSMHGI